MHPARGRSDRIGRSCGGARPARTELAMVHASPPNVGNGGIATYSARRAAARRSNSTSVASSSPTFVTVIVYRKSSPSWRIPSASELFVTWRSGGVGLGALDGVADVVRVVVLRRSARLVRRRDVRRVHDRTAELFVDRDRDVDRGTLAGADVAQRARDEARRLAASRGGGDERDARGELVGDLHPRRGGGAVVRDRERVGDRVAVLDDALRVVRLDDRDVGRGRHVVPAEGEMAQPVVAAVGFLRRVEVLVAGVARRDS